MDKHISSILLAFRGDLSGEYILRTQILNETCITEKSPRIECRLDPELVQYALNVLRLTCHVALVRVSSPQTKEYRIVPKCPSQRDNSCVLSVTAMCRQAWLAVPVLLDVQLLTINATTWAVRSRSKHMQRLLPALVKQVRDRRFRVMRYDKETMNCANIWVTKGWHMLPERGGPWQICIPTPSDHHQQVCAICQSNTTTSYPIIQLSCYHAFHVRCPDSYAAGLYEWIHTHGKDTCPLCRAPLTEGR